MDDQRVWSFERDLWVGAEDIYRTAVASDCVMALPASPFLYDGDAATAAVEETPRWDEVAFERQHVSRPQEGLIVVGYEARATRGDEHYHAVCTTTMLRREHEDWVVVQHQQTPLGLPISEDEGN